jgi:Protein of unknown function (DUF1553)/Protein of unknown function (DUF1549)/Concanavalin A-like lectin/glucanases superfamily/Planctomycete cytochrome C
VILAALQTLVLLSAPPQPVEFNRDIRPILSDHCFQCHGPDKNKRKAKLRLDTEEGILSVVSFAKPLDSELFKRLIAKDDTERMPPRRFDRPLNERQIQLLKRWIEEGSQWQKHWAFIPPQRPPVPRIANLQSPLSDPIDAFLLERMSREGLAFSPAAEKTTLLRRVTLDLTGLPPTPAEVEAFLKDDSPGAYEKVVDRLLASSRFGERLAIDWLDAARYADSNGYQSDGERFMWRWRDWVIDAFNSNMPFDRFTIEQLAGDLLPNPTLEQKIATGFNRNHRGNAEGGIVPEEYAVEYVVDRVDTTMAVWQGLTIGCARCHDHKYDPLSHKEYYQLYAYFNNVPELGRAIKYGNSPPVMKAPTREQQNQLRSLTVRLARAEKAFAALQTETDAAQARWEKSLVGRAPLDWTVTDGLVAHYALDGSLAESAGRHKPGQAQEGPATFAPGRLGSALDLDGHRYADVGDVGHFGFYDKFSLSAWVMPRGSQGGVIVSRVSESLRGDGYMLRLENGRLQLDLTKRWLDDALRIETEEKLEPGRWHHVAATYDGSRVASGARLYIDGRFQKGKVLLDELNQSFDTKAPLRIGAGGGAEARFHGLIDEVCVHGKSLSAEEAAILAVPDTVSALASIPPGKRSLAQAQKLRAAFLNTAAPAPIQKAFREVVALRLEREQLEENVSTVMVMEELPTPRDAFVLLRGQYDKRGDKVTPGLPGVLDETARPQAGKKRKTRLDFARWLVSPDNPLTARVIVNRYWQHYFGTGLVKTAEDFGSQGEAPSHPELLDWLATEFVRTGWDVKAMQRLIVTSAAYRQSSKVTPLLLQKDPANRLLARGPRLRLPAEIIRDQALFASGLLVEHIGGPSVKTYHPPGLWEELSGVAYNPDRGESLYRRSLYTFWKRTVTPPAMATFDASAREACTVNRARTNTPLQALTLLNDVPFVEASRVLAERLLREATTPDERLTLAFLRVTGRRPREVELQVLRAGLERHLAHYRKNPEAAKKLLAVGMTARNPSLDPAEVAAHAAIAGLILNLDEVVTRE